MLSVLSSGCAWTASLPSGPPWSANAGMPWPPGFEQFGSWFWFTLRFVYGRMFEPPQFAGMSGMVRTATTRLPLALLMVQLLLCGGPVQSPVLTFVWLKIFACRCRLPGSVFLSRTAVLSFGFGLLPNSTLNEPCWSLKFESSRIICESSDPVDDDVDGDVRGRVVAVPVGDRVVEAVRPDVVRRRRVADRLAGAAGSAGHDARRPALVGRHVRRRARYRRLAGLLDRRDRAACGNRVVLLDVDLIARRVRVHGCRVVACAERYPGHGVVGAGGGGVGVAGRVVGLAGADRSDHGAVGGHAADGDVVGRAAAGDGRRRRSGGAAEGHVAGGEVGRRPR